MHNTRFDLEKTVLQPHHIRACSGLGYMGVVPGTISGIRSLGFAPFTGNDYRLLIDFLDPVTGFRIKDWEEFDVSDSVEQRELIGGFPDAADPRSLYHGATWLGWGIERKGAVHWRQNDQLISFRLKTIAAPLATKFGFCLSFEFTEIDVPGDSLVLQLHQKDFHFGAVRPWVWVDPVSKYPARRLSATDFEGENSALCLGVADGTLDGNSWTIPLGGRKSLTVHLAVVIAADALTARAQLKEVLAAPAENISYARSEWERLARELTGKLPEFRCDSPELEAYYEGGLRTLLTNRWDTPEFFLRPFFSTSGLGYSNGAYFWDMSYCPKVMSLWDPVAVRKHLVQWLSVDLHACNQFSGFDGAPMGGWYALNDFAIVKLVYEYCEVTGDKDFLNAQVGDRTVIERLEQLLNDSETRFEKKNNLLNFGRNENLLELRSSGYEGYVASPNGERYFCWRKLADLKELLGLSSQSCREQAELVKEGFFGQLWNEEKGWVDAITPEGRRETPYSIQVYNLLSSGLFEGEKLDAILKHLNDDEFLSSHGAESISKADIRYELSDLDWGGGGTYLGCCPVMALDLYQLGRPEKAWDILSRLLWWPSVLPYYPQVIRARKAGYEERQRPTCICGGAAAEAVVFGIFGVRYELDGRVSACVQLPPGMRTASLRRINLREGTCDILVEDGKIRICQGDQSREIAAGERVLLS